MRSNKIHNVDLFTQAANDNFQKHVKTQSKQALEIINKKMNWTRLLQPIERAVAKERSGGSSAGRSAMDLLVIVKCFLLQSIYNLSDPRLEEEIADRRSFQIFLGLSSNDAIPDETTICRYRELFARLGLDKKLFEGFNRQLTELGLIIGKGTIVYATTQIVHTADFTPAHIPDSRLFDAMLLGSERRVYADKGYASAKRSRALTQQGIRCSIMFRAARAHPLSAQQKQINRRLSTIRSAVERPFAFLKRILGYTRCRYYDLSRNRFQFLLALIVYNIRRSITLRIPRWT